MHGTLAIAHGKANLVGAESCTKSPRSVEINLILGRTCRTVFGRKTWSYLTELFGVSERSAKSRLACEREFTADELAVLLRSENGLRFLVAVMGDAQPAWWKTFKGHIALLDARKLQRAAQRRLQEAIDAETDLSAAIARADLLSDEEFHRPHGDALRSMARIPDRAVASATGRR
jgi:hypothetical protein